MEITSKTKNTITEWCERKGVPVDAGELKNYKHFLALDGLDRVTQGDRLAVATMKIAANAGALGYVSAILKSTVLRDMWGKEETQYTPVFKDDNRRSFYDALKANNVPYCEVIDRQHGKFYVCYLPEELENKKAELLQQQQDSEAKSRALSAEIQVAKKQKEQLEDKIKQLDSDHYRAAHNAAYCSSAYNALKHSVNWR